MNRREFTEVLGLAAAAGLLSQWPNAEAAPRNSLYDLPSFGTVSLLHFTDTHAQLNPIRYREASSNLGVGVQANQPPFLVGDDFVRHYKIPLSSPLGYAFTPLGFEKAARRYGKLGGYAHLSTLIKQLRASRPEALLLDGGDSWQGSATALWTQAQDMVEASALLGVDMMTGHWEFTYGQDRLQDVLAKEFRNKTDFLAQNVRSIASGDPVFKPYVIRVINGVPVATIGQAYPYTPIANPRHLVPDWSFGIQDENLQRMVRECRNKGAAVVVLLSHNGTAVDLKLASRIRGLDVILGGHSHDPMPQPVVVKNPSGQTLVTNAGSHGKFLAVLDLDVRGGRLLDYRYKLLPVFSRMLPPDPEMSAHIAKVRAPYKAKLEERLGVTEGLLYRRDNFMGSFDQLILDAMIAVKGAEIALSPGYRFGTSLLPGEDITREALMDQVAITYPHTVVTPMTGEVIKQLLEDNCDALFNPDPYLQQGHDLVRVAGLSFSCAPEAPRGRRIQDLRHKGKPLEADKSYVVARWAPLGSRITGEPIWEVVEAYLASQKRITTRKLNLPKLVGMRGNKGLA